MLSSSDTPSANPKKLLFTMMSPHNTWGSNTDNEHSIESLLNRSPNMTVVDISDLPNGTLVEEHIIDHIRRQVKQHGTLEEFMIFGHGESERQYIGSEDGLSGLKNLYYKFKAESSGGREDAIVNIHTDSFLKKLEALQEELGVKVADRIVFMGCNVLTNLSAEQVGEYRRAAQNLHAEIVGSTNTILITGGGWIGDALGAEALLTADFIQFTPAGDVVPDRLTNPTTPNEVNLLDELADGISSLLGASPSWAECHTNTSQEAGAQCQETPQSLPRIPKALSGNWRR